MSTTTQKPSLKKAHDLVFIDLSDARFKFSLRDPARFRQGLRGGDEAMREYEKLLDQRVFKRSLNKNGDATCSAQHSSGSRNSD